MPPPLSIHAWLRFDAVDSLLGRAQGIRSVLEIGAGGGGVGALLARRYDYVGLEPDPASFALAEKRVGSSGRVLRAAVEELAEADQFDLVVALEVLEHFSDDRAALETWRRLVRPGGWLLISVPAGSHRMGPADVRAGHYRRYDRAALSDLLQQADFTEVSIRAYGFPLGYALEAVRNALARQEVAARGYEERTRASGRWLQPPDGAAPLTWLAALPFRLAQRPFADSDLGTGLVALARR